MAKQEYFFPSIISESETQLLTYTAMIGILEGTERFLYKRIFSWILHLQCNYAIYESQAREKPICLTRVLYYIDILVQKQLSLFQDPSIPLQAISYSPITDGFLLKQNKVTDRCLITNIPESLIQHRSSSIKKRKTDSLDTTKKKSENKSDRSTTSGSSKRSNTGESVTNTNHNP
jgi:hypothetical protein